MALSVKCHFGSLYSRRVTLVFMRIDIRVVFGTCSDIVLAIFLFQQTWWRFGSVSDFSLEKVFNSIRPVPEQSFVDRTVFPIFVIVELFKWIWYTKTIWLWPLYSPVSDKYVFFCVWLRRIPFNSWFRFSPNLCNNVFLCLCEASNRKLMSLNRKQKLGFVICYVIKAKNLDARYIRGICDKKIKFIFISNLVNKYFKHVIN